MNGLADRRDYNVNAVLRNDITAPMLRFMVEQVQRDFGLPVDGKAGPVTVTAIWQRMHRGEAPPLAVGNLSLGLRTLAYALAEIGKGEDPRLGNNLGEDIDRYCELAGMPWLVGTGPYWCSIFDSAMLVKACLPGRPPFDMSPKAKTLWENASKSPGARIVDTPEPASLNLYKRRNKLGIVIGHHINITEKYDAEKDLLVTVDGNRNLRGQKFALVDRFPQQQGSWRKDYVGSVVLP